MGIESLPVDVANKIYGKLDHRSQVNALQANRAIQISALQTEVFRKKEQEYRTKLDKVMDPFVASYQHLSARIADGRDSVDQVFDMNHDTIRSMLTNYRGMLDMARPSNITNVNIIASATRSLLSAALHYNEACDNKIIAVEEVADIRRNLHVLDAANQPTFFCVPPPQATDGAVCCCEIM